MKKTTTLFFAILNILVFAQAPSIQWSKCYGGGLYDDATTIINTSDGGFAFVGYSYSNNGDLTNNYGMSDVWFVKTNSVGDIVWQKSFGGSQGEGGYSIIETSDGGFLISGTTGSNDGDISGNHGGGDVLIIKINSTGTILWKKCYGGSQSDSGTRAIQTSDGGYMIIGSTLSNNGDVSGFHAGSGPDFWAIKINASGTIQWQKCYGGTNGEFAYSVQQTSDGGYIMIGHTYSTDGDVIGNHGGKDIWIIKTNSLGVIQWQKSIGGSLDDLGYYILQTSDLGFILAGTSDSNDGDVLGNHGNSDVFVVKLDNSGNIQWKKCLGGSGCEGSEKIILDSDGGYVVAGYSCSNDGDVSGHYGSVDYWIVKINSIGIIQWQKSLGGTYSDSSRDVVQTSDSGYALVGSVYSNNNDVSGNHGDKDVWVVKLNSTIGITEQNSYDKIIFYPNPTSNKIFVSELKFKFSLRLLNLLGQVIIENNYSNNIDLSRLPNGIFYIQLLDEKGLVIKTEKIIKE